MSDNRNQMSDDLRRLPFERGKLFIVENYLEAVGVMAALKGGVSVPSVRRPLAQTRVPIKQLGDEQKEEE